MLTWRAAMIAVLVLAGCADTESDLVRGTVEVREVDVASLVAGRVASVIVEEGAVVRVGDTLAVIATPTMTADLDAAEARVASARAMLRDLEAGSDPERVAAAEADLAAATADAARLDRERDRMRALLDAGAIAPRDAEAATTAAAVASARVDAAREQVALLRAGTRRDRIAAARAEVAQAEALVAGRVASHAEQVLVAPIDGVVLARLREPGDMVGPSGAVVRVGDVTEPWVRVYVPASMLVVLAVGDSAAIYPPGAGGAVARDEVAATRGQIVAINPRAEFVTRTALTEDERADLLFGVKVAILDTLQRFKPGMPVSVRLHTRSTTP